MVVAELLGVAMSEKWRPLKEGERIEAGDEWFDGNIWVPVEEDSGDVGMKYVPMEWEHRGTDGTTVVGRIKWRRLCDSTGVKNNAGPL